MPVPMVNILSGGLHAGGLIEVQDFLVIPHGFPRLAESLEAVVSVHRATRDLLARKGYVLHGVADEGGWGPALPSNEAALQLLTEVIGSVGLPRPDVDCHRRGLVSFLGMAGTTCFAAKRAA